MFKVPEQLRTMGTPGVKAGMFKFIKNTKNRPLNFKIIASDGGGWEHVSVSLDRKRCCTWEEMCIIKSLFWDDEDFVVQMHPPKADWVNNHNFCLHLWRKYRSNDYCERPPSILIGYK